MPSANTIKGMAAQWVARRDAGLSASESAELQVWLDADPDHCAAFRSCDTAWDALDRPFHVGAADELLRAVETRVKHRRRRVVSRAGGLAVLLVVGLLWYRAAGPVVTPHDPSRTAIILPTRQNLPDGSIIELKDNAEIAVVFTATSRRVQLKHGEAHFRVAKEGSRPFLVNASGVEVRAVGTAFSVQLGTASVEVLVTEGTVAVDKPPLAASALTMDLSAPLATVHAGNRVVVEIAPQSAAPQVQAVATADAEMRLAWRAPRLEFSGTSLAQAVALLNQEAAKAAAAGQSAPRYVIGDPDIEPIRVSGLFRVDNTESFVRLLKHGFGIEAEPRGNFEIVLRKER